MSSEESSDESRFRILSQPQVLLQGYTTGLVLAKRPLSCILDWLTSTLHLQNCNRPSSRSLSIGLRPPCNAAELPIRQSSPYAVYIGQKVSKEALGPPMTKIRRRNKRYCQACPYRSTLSLLQTGLLFANKRL